METNPNYTARKSPEKRLFDEDFGTYSKADRIAEILKTYPRVPIMFQMLGELVFENIGFIAFRSPGVYTDVTTLVAAISQKSMEVGNGKA